MSRTPAPTHTTPAASDPASATAPTPEPGRGPSTTARPANGPAREFARRCAASLTSAAAALTAILLVWEAFIRAVDVSDFVAKSPADVWTYLVLAPTAGDHRRELAALLAVTLRDAALGYATGLALAAAVALSFYFSRTLERMFVPSVTALSAIPMVTVAPILVLVFGRGATAAAVIGAAIVFVPALLMMLNGITSTPRVILDMCRSYGAGRIRLFWTCALPSALPTWFAAARLAVANSVIGALLAQWLSSGEGLGGQMLLDANQFQFDRLWSSVALLTFASVLVYQAVALVEKTVSARMSGTS